MKAIEKLKEKIGSKKKELSIKENGYEIVSLNQIKKGQPFIDLFPINKETLKSITEDMKVNGYDVSQPVIIWQEVETLIDGHSRCAAAEKAGLTEVAVIYESFPDVDSALKYAYSLQFNRRNLTDSDRFSFSETYMNNVGQGSKKVGWKKKELSEILSVSVTTAQKYISVISRGSERTKQAVRAGDMTINSAYNSLLHKEKGGSSTTDTESNKPSKKKGRSKPISQRKSSGSIELNVSELKKILGKWGKQRDMVLDGNLPYFPYKERLLGVKELLPNNSDLKAYVSLLIEGGDTK